MPLEPSVYWTDSTSVLKYLRNETSRFHTFVANRVASIRAASDVTQWRYVGSTQNPADCASRGLSVMRFYHSRWIQGPEFLQKIEAEWPQCPELGSTQDDPEVKVFSISVVLPADEAVNTVTRLITYYSDWHHLRKAVAWILKIKDALREAYKKRKEGKVTLKERSGKTLLSVDELQNAEKAIIQFCQLMEYKETSISQQRNTCKEKQPHT